MAPEGVGKELWVEMNNGFGKVTGKVYKRVVRPVKLDDTDCLNDRRQG